MKSLPLHNIHVILILLLAALPMACKKEEANDPNINDRTINKTYTAFSTPGYAFVDPLDIDQDETVDITYGVIFNDSIQTLIMAMKDGNMLAESITLFGTSIAANASLASGTVLDANSVLWGSGAFVSYNSTRINKVADFGIHGKGDQYLGFQINKTVGNYLYGWLKVNLSADSKTFIIKELAVQKVINKSIKVGEK